MQDGFGGQGETVTIHVSTNGEATAREVDGSHRDLATLPAGPTAVVGFATKGGGTKIMADGGAAKRVETLEEVQASLRAIASAVHSLQFIVANELEQERAHADDMPLDEYYAAAAMLALDDASPLESLHADGLREDARLDAEMGGDA